MLADHLKHGATSGGGIIHYGADFVAAADEPYRSDTLCVRAFPGRDTSRWFITFDHVQHDGSLDRAGFGETFFRRRGISLVTVIGRGNDWYQYPDMARALKAIRHALEQARVRIVYGSSMGGYAAIRFADAVDATACLALSPQYSSDPRKVPFEKRWLALSRSIDWRDELEHPIRCRIKPVVIYDSRDDDARHAGLIATDTRLSPVAVPHGGHPITTYLSAAGLLIPLIEALHDGNLDVDAFAQAARDRRKSTPAWIAELARRQPPHRSRIAERLARDALSRQPDHDLLTHILAQILTTKGAHGEALQLHRRAYELSGRLLDYGIPYSQAVHQTGSSRRALDIAIELRERYPHSEALSEWIAELHLRMGNLDRAIEQAAAALAGLPSDDRHQAAAGHYRVLLRLRERQRSSTKVSVCLGRAWKLVRSGFAAQAPRRRVDHIPG